MRMSVDSPGPENREMGGAIRGDHSQGLPLTLSSATHAHQCSESLESFFGLRLKAEIRVKRFLIVNQSFLSLPGLSSLREWVERMCAQ